MRNYEPNMNFGHTRCVGCESAMDIGGSCTLRTVTIGAVDHDRLPFGSEEYFADFGDKHFWDADQVT